MWLKCLHIQNILNVEKIQTVCDPSWKGSEFPKWWTEYMEYNLAAEGGGCNRGFQSSQMHWCIAHWILLWKGHYAVFQVI